MRGLVGSLRFKATAGVVLILSLALGSLFAVQYRWFHRELIERLGLSSTPLSDVIKGSLKHAMETRSLSEIDAILANVSRQQGVVKVFVVDKRGQIRFSPVAGEAGTTIALGEPTCQICHRSAPAARSRTVIFTAADGSRVFRNVNPIANEPACHGCHDSRQAINGVLISDFSMTEIDQRLAGKVREMIVALLVTVGSAGLLITLTMNRLVIGKLEQIVEATKLLGQGKLDFRVDVKPKDEIGELASAFNRMLGSLRRAKQLRERTELLENVLNHVDDAVVVFSPDGAVTAFNRGAERILGVSATEVLGRPYPLLGEDSTAILGCTPASRAVVTERELRRAGGERFAARVHVVPLRSESGEPVGCLAVAQDLTEERVKERLQEQLAQTEKLAAVGRLAAGVAHELNNPLGNVLLYAKLLLEDSPASDPRHANARHVVDNTLRCKAIVRGLLDYAKRSEVRMDWTDLNAVVRASAELVPEAARRNGITLELRLDPTLPRVRCDGAQIQQVLVNLVQNAIEATDGHGLVQVSTALADRGDAVLVQVLDDGRGVPPEARSRIFEPFYTTKEEGTGLGLAICYGIVARHGGSIGVDSRCDGPARGTTFSVRLPLTEESTAAAAPSNGGSA